MAGSLAAAVAFAAALGAAAEPRSWEQALEEAAKVMPKIDFRERRAWLHGIKVGEEHHKFGSQVHVPAHKGYTRRNKDLGVPLLKFEDGASGYHALDDAVGTSTCFPSLLALASTWDTELTQAYGTAIGTEFKGKGASVLMGPRINVHHAANDGRNVLSLSGEDPYLGATLVREYIAGVHSQGVIAAPKNFAFPEARSAAVTDSAAWQLYYPPFEAAVEAGAVAMTCPGNMVNGQPACGSSKLLTSDLRGKMGFKGFVVSDWGATAPSGLAMGGLKMVENGLDLEMPSDQMLSDMGLIFADRKPDGDTQKTFDKGVMHILAAIYKMGLDSEEGCSGPHQCKEALHANVTSSSHASLARSVATDAVTLLKNDGVLPLEPSGVKAIAVVGPAADKIQDVSASEEFTADYYSAGGPEHCRAAYVVTPLAAIKHRAAKRGIKVTSSTSPNVDEALAAVTDADVVIVVAAATSTANEPRQSMSLDDDMDSLIAQVAKVKRTVVLMQTPGAVLTPWRGEVSAVANLFLAGQETGSAWAAVVFGDAEPAGRLPVVFPATQEGLDLETAEPAMALHTDLLTSYRQGSEGAAFPFGHGLSYTSFGYGSPELKAGCSAKICVGLRVSNTGSRKGREVAQVYLQFPAMSKVPSKLLRGFKKTALLAPGESEELTFAFSERDLSTFTDGAWSAWDGIVARFGASSMDLRQELVLDGKKVAAALAAEAAKPAETEMAGPEKQADKTDAEAAKPAETEVAEPEKQVGKKGAEKKTRLRKARIAKHS